MCRDSWREEGGLPPLPKVMTVDEAARALRISRSSAYEAVRTGEIPSRRIGRRILVPYEALVVMLTAECGVAAMQSQTSAMEGAIR